MNDLGDEIVGDAPILVTGSSGLVGSAVRRMVGSKQRLIAADGHHGVDIMDWGVLMEFMRRHQGAGGIGGVIHLAAFTNVSTAHAQQGDDDGRCYRLNVNGTRNVVAACRELGLFLVHVSTDFVFAGDRDEPYRETDTPAPIEWYGETKLRAEEAVSAYEQSAIVRIAFPYAAGQTPRQDVVRTILEKLRAGDSLKLFADQIVTPSFADDIAQGLLELNRAGLRNELHAGEVFHLTGPESISPHQLGLQIAREFGLSSERIEATSLQDYLKVDPRPRQRCLRIDTSKWRAWAAQRGLKMPVGIEEGLRRVRQSLEQD